MLEGQIDFAETEAPEFIKAIAKYGISHVTASFPSTAVDLTPQMQELKADGAQAVFMEPAGGRGPTARSTLKWNVPVIFDIAASSLDLTKLVSPSLVKHNV